VPSAEPQTLGIILAKISIIVVVVVVVVEEAYSSPDANMAATPILRTVEMCSL
jgi:hypothetical protein